MAKFITVPSTATGYATASIPNGGPINLPLDLIFDVKQTQQPLPLSILIID